ncbi:AsmA-like C-terminal region-containing protein, partial [Methylopila musalis]
RALALLGLGGRIEVRTAEGSVTVAGGVARTEDLRLGGPSAELRLAGDANLTSGRLNLAGVLAVTDGGAIPARVRGRIDDPKLRLDPLGSDRRSDATPAP